MRSIIVFLFLAWQIWALEPNMTIETDGNVIETVESKGILYAGTDKGQVQMFELSSGKPLGAITLEKIKDFMGDLMPPKVFSVDVMEERVLMMSEAAEGARNLTILEKNGTLNQIIGKNDRLSIRHAKFTDNNHVLLGLISNETILVDLNTKKRLYRIQLSASAFSHFALNETRTLAAWACESGIIYIIDVQKGKVVKELKGGNKDNVYKVDFKNQQVITAGQDRKASLYDVDSGNHYEFEASFLVYSAGLSPSAKRVGIASDEKSNVVVFDTFGKQKITTLNGHKSTINTILFLDENTVVTSDDDPQILIWRLP